MPALQIYDARERALVTAADLVLGAAAAPARLFRHARRPSAAPQRILLLRLERIGDLIMTLPALADLRALAPGARLDLVVGSWNLALARAVAVVNAVESLDAGWLARGGAGRPLRSLIRTAWKWRARRYDLAINFEPDIRSNVVAAAAGAAWSAGYRSGGGGSLLDLAIDFNPRAHSTANARRLVAAAFGRDEPTGPAPPVLAIPEPLRRAAAARLPAGAGPIIGIHASGGREIKQWDPARFAAVARRLVEERGATIVLTGAEADRPLVELVKAGLPAGRVVDVAGEPDLLALAAMLERLDLLITGDTGPMHLAGAVGTPVVAVFGPSDPRRYAPAGPRDRIVRVDLPCAPCNRIRLPPARCVGHVPDCLAGVTVEHVLEAAMVVLQTA